MSFENRGGVDPAADHLSVVTADTGFSSNFFKIIIHTNSTTMSRFHFVSCGLWNEVILCTHTFDF